MTFLHRRHRHCSCYSAQPPSALQAAKQQGWDAALAMLANVRYDNAQVQREVPVRLIQELRQMNPWDPQRPVETVARSTGKAMT